METCVFMTKETNLSGILKEISKKKKFIYLKVVMKYKEIDLQMSYRKDSLLLKEHV